MKSEGILCLAMLVVQPSLAAAAAVDLQSDLEQMMEWFEGEFDNNQQVLEEREEPPEQPHEWIHSIFRRVALPAFGEHVFYVEQYLDGDPAKIYRNRLYSFAVDEEEEAVELVIYRFPDEKAVVGAHDNPSLLGGASPETLSTLPGCEVYWQRDEDRFVGYMKQGACRVLSQRSGKTLIISDDLVLTPEEIWISDRAEDEEGNWVFGNRQGIHHKLKRARRFDCWAAVKTGEGEGDWQGFRDLELHDQGGRAVLKLEGEEPPRATLVLEQRVYRGENQVPILKLAVEEPDKEQATAYTWTDPGAGRLGLNLRWLQGGCTRRGV